MAGYSSSYSAPKIGRRANAKQIYNAATEYAQHRGLTVKAGRAQLNKGQGASTSLPAGAGDVSRQRKLMASLKRRTTESSRQRLLNRVLSASNVRAE